MFGAGFKMRTGGAFLPTSLPNIQLWLRGDLGITTTINTVNTWADQVSANSFTKFIGTTTYTASDSSYGNQSTLTMSGSDLESSTSSNWFGVTQPFTLYAVGEADTSSQQSIIEDSHGGLDAELWLSGGKWGISAGGTGFSSIAGTLSTPLAFCGVYNGSSSALYIDNSSIAVGTGTVGVAGFLGNTFVGGSSNALTGKVAELICYGGAHTNSQIAQVFAYFATRYGKNWG